MATRTSWPMALLLPLMLVGCGGTPAAPGQGAASDPPLQVFTGRTMGSTYEVKFVGVADLAAVQAVVAEELAAFDATFSNWRDDSEIARCNRHASSEPFAVTPRFAAVLQQALAVAAATEGAFDPTVKPLSDLYRAAKRDPQHRLEPAAAATARRHVDYRQVQLRDGALVKGDPELQLDLDGLVAGAAADAIAARLAPFALQGLYLQITGEVLCRGDKGAAGPWRIGVVDPDSDAMGGEQPIRTLALRDRALCTSGDYRNGFVRDGTFVHHVFDPRTGRNPDHHVVSASILAASAALADAFGTAALVLGEAGTQRLWPGWQQRFGLQGALLLMPGEGGTLRSLEITWPKEDS